METIVLVLRAQPGTRSRTRNEAEYRADHLIGTPVRSPLMIVILASIEYEYRCTEYRFAEYEYESCAQRRLGGRQTMIEVALSNARWYDEAW